MKYISKNRLSDFELHDAVLTLESFVDHRLIAQAA